jgi:hypothetical protein
MIKKSNLFSLFIIVLVLAVIFFAMKYFNLSFQDIKDSIEYVIAIISLLATAIGFYAKMTHNKKMAALAESLNAINSYAQEAVDKAEDFIGYSGENKKQYALTYINQKCIDAGILFDSALASELIEKFVVLSNKVGSRHKIEETKQIT